MQERGKRKMRKGMKLRITWEPKNGEPDIEEYENCVFGFKFYSKEIYIDAEGVGELNVKKIVKIEKQVKDLTLEEIEMLGVEFERLYPRDERYKAQYLIDNENYLEDDYIDITSIVKEK